MRTNRLAIKASASGLYISRRSKTGILLALGKRPKMLLALLKMQLKGYPKKRCSDRKVIWQRYLNQKHPNALL